MSSGLIINERRAVTRDEYGILKTSIDLWNQRAQRYFELKTEADRVRDCMWSGKDLSGQDWDANHENSPDDVGIFDGAADLSVRLVDFVISDKAALLLVAARMANIRITSVGAQNELLAQNLNAMIHWVIDDMGSAYWLEIARLVNFYLANTPAISMMRLMWNKRMRLEDIPLTWQLFQEAMTQREVSRAVDENSRIAAIQRVQAILADILNEQDPYWSQGVTMIMELTGCSKRAAERALSELVSSENGETRVMSRVSDGGRVKLRALEFGSDFVIPDTTRDFEDEGIWFVPEWLTLAQLDAKVQDGWDEDFIQSVKDQGTTSVINNGWEVKTPSGESGALAMEGRRQVIWCFVCARDDEGAMGKWVAVFGRNLGEDQNDVLSAFGWDLVSGYAGKWPAVLFTREIRSKFIMDAKGVAELAAPSQGIVKRLYDGQADNAIISMTPPIIAKGSGARNQSVSPLKTIGVGINEDFQYMRNPEYPAVSVRVRDDVINELYKFFGMPGDKSDDSSVNMRQRWEILWFLQQFAQVIHGIIQLWQVNADEELLASVTGLKADVNGSRVAAVRGRFGVTVSLNPDDLDTDVLIKKMSAISQAMGMDTKKVVNTAPFMKHFMTRMAPDFGLECIQNEETAQQDELDDEAMNLTKIRAGIMPTIDTEGKWNYGLRLSMYRQMIDADPNVFADMAPDKRAKLEDWMKALSQQQTQFGVNRAIGKTGAQQVESQQ